jgi:hypothetical protein
MSSPNEILFRFLNPPCPSQCLEERLCLLEELHPAYDVKSIYLSSNRLLDLRMKGLHIARTQGKGLTSIDSSIGCCG